jgi:DNA-binding transcriptional MerR regulator
MKLVRTVLEFDKWCDEHKYTRSELAEILRVSRQTIHNWTSTKLTRELRRNTHKGENDFDERTREHEEIQ